ncbi:hypothetical protein Bbelb_265510, partial [Branchiostoma belcheri]
ALRVQQRVEEFSKRTILVSSGSQVPDSAAVDEALNVLSVLARRLKRKRRDDAINNLLCPFVFPRHDLVPDINIQLNCGYKKADHTGPPQSPG